MDLKLQLQQLIAQPSITPEDAGCQVLLQTWLQELGFTCEQLPRGRVKNLFATLGGDGPHIVFLGHTDVVPAGDLNLWRSDPFQLHEANGYFFGRGVADMKGSIVCMVQAASMLLQQQPNFNGRLSFLITSGEEGDDFADGTPFVLETLYTRGIKFDYCIVGEPSSTQVVGDTIKIGRRGSLTGHLTLQGVQGHVAYPHLAENPLHKIAPFLAELTQTNWDQQKNTAFPPTSLQLTQLHVGAGANNIIPGTLDLHFNYRYTTEHSAESLQQQVLTCLQRHGLMPTIKWQHNGNPFLTTKGALLNACVDTIIQHTGKKPELSTAGGTSDGRFIALYGVEVIELGPVNATIHQVNEAVAMQDLSQLAILYCDICKRLKLI